MSDKIDITFTEDYAPKYGDAPSFKKGDQEAMAGDSARHYMGRGVAITTEEYKAMQIESEGEGFDDARIQEIVSAISLLEEGNEEHWTNKGKPEIAALKSIMDGSVSGAERDAAWKAVQSAGDND